MPAKNPAPTQPDNALPGGTRVLNTTDGEPGTILNGYAWTAAGWTEYEVETAHAIELWKREDFVLFSDLPAADEPPRPSITGASQCPPTPRPPASPNPPPPRPTPSAPATSPG